MIRWAFLFVLLLVAATGRAQALPENVRVSTWIREDLFAGLLANDMERFEAGVKKLKDYQSARPDQPEALAWQGFADLVRAVKANEAGQEALFRRWYDSALASFDRARLGGSTEGVLAITGGSWTSTAERLPVAFRADAHRRGYENYLALKQRQARFFDKLPVHMRGEVLAGLAQSSGRLGRSDEARKWLDEIVVNLPGTPYESRAKRWLANPELAESETMTCLTCHDAGRLSNVMKSAGIR
jgi:tetratricopeptide (TPR) repeat protein